jgi:hypothetical protein
MTGDRTNTIKPPAKHHFDFTIEDALSPRLPQLGNRGLFPFPYD